MFRLAASRAIGWTIAIAAIPAIAVLPASAQAAEKSGAANPLGVYLARNYVFVDEPPLESYLQSVAARLLATGATAAPPPRILIFSSDAFDAFTDASRNLFISTGALRALDSEDELAALLGHELSHLVLKHPQQKESLRAFPLGIETIESVERAASALRGGGTRAAPADLDAAGGQRLTNLYTANLLWNDVIAPGWNRKQERAADQHGFEMMRLAGYDPSAFGALFQKLADASGKRSKRLETLKTVMLARARASAKSKAASQSPSRKIAGFDTARITDAFKDTLTEQAVEGVVSGLASFNRDYDSPDLRQALLATYAGEHRLASRPARPVAAFKGVLRQGGGGRVLQLDAAAIRLVGALSAGDSAAALRATSGLLPATPGARPVTPHLNLALGAWYQSQRRADLGERHSSAWLGARLPPAQAYLWSASYQAQRHEYAAATKTLERGRERVGDAAIFLPYLVSLAKLAGNKPRAEELTMQCAEEDRRHAGMKVAAMFRSERIPTGLYADCVARLGYEPAAAAEPNAAMRALKKPVEAGKSLTSKLRDKFISK